MKRSTKLNFTVAAVSALLTSHTAFAIEGNNSLGTGASAQCFYREKSCQKVTWDGDNDLGRQALINRCIVDALSSGWDEARATRFCYENYGSSLCTYEIHIDYLNCPDTVQYFRTYTNSLNECRNACRRELTGIRNSPPTGEYDEPWLNDDRMGVIKLF